MSPHPEAFRVPLDAFVMQLRPSELEAVAQGLSAETGSPVASPASLIEAVRALPVTDRAPLWELAIRHYARRKPLERATSEIGMDALRGRALLDAFTRNLSMNSDSPST